MRCARDRALLSCYVSSGARASELLGVGLGDIDWTKGQLWVISKGHPGPAAGPCLPGGPGLPRRPPGRGRPATGCDAGLAHAPGRSEAADYWAARRIIQRADEAIGTNWTLHDLRHTAATRLARDPEPTLVEVRSILRHAHISTTDLYTVVGLDDLVDKLAEHYARPVQPTTWPQRYDAADVEAVFGAGKQGRRQPADQGPHDQPGPAPRECRRPGSGRELRAHRCHPRAAVPAESAAPLAGQLRDGLGGGDHRGGRRALPPERVQDLEAAAGDARVPRLPGRIPGRHLAGAVGSLRPRHRSTRRPGRRGQHRPAPPPECGGRPRLRHAPDPPTLLGCGPTPSPATLRGSAASPAIRGWRNSASGSTGCRSAPPAAAGPSPTSATR
ncbi:site-specific integrase [Streptomyces scopuliridis]